MDVAGGVFVLFLSIIRKRMVLSYFHSKTIPPPRFHSAPPFAQRRLSVSLAFARQLFVVFVLLKYIFLQMCVSKRLSVNSQKIKYRKVCSERLPCVKGAVSRSSTD